MWTVIPMSHKLYAMETDAAVDSLDGLQYDSDEIDRLQTFLDEGQPIIIVQDLDDLDCLSSSLEIEIVERSEDETA